jgi:DNA-binding response OmpR family regulator
MRQVVTERGYQLKSPITGRKTILVVEDEAAIREFCRRVLAGEGFEVDIAADGKVAQNMLKKRQYDLHLLDMKMPVLGGKELYRWLQETYPGSEARVVFITGSVVGEDTQSFLRQCGRPWLSKPFTANELKAKVVENIGG